MKTRITAFMIAMAVGITSTYAISPSNTPTNNAPIASHIDLSKVVDDKVPVKINPGPIETESVTYRLPKVVQGTYSVSDFGKFVDDFRAFDASGNELPIVSKIDTNSWMILDATKLD